MKQNMSASTKQFANQHYKSKMYNNEMINHKTN